VRILTKYADNVIREEKGVGGQVSSVTVKNHDTLYDGFRRLGWRFRELVYSSLLEVDRARYLGVDVHLDIGPTHGSVAEFGLAGAWARDEDAVVEFTATLMAASERKSVPHLLRVAGTGGNPRVIQDTEYSPKRDGEVLGQSKMDMQEAVLEDMTDRDRPQRVNARLYGTMHVDQFRRGQRIRVKGLYRSEAQKGKKGIAYTYWVEVIEAEAVEDIDAASWTRDEVDQMIGRRRELGTRKFLESLADSLAPMVPGQFWPKVACMLSAVGGASLREGEPPNIHTLLVGDPGTGKSAIMIDLVSMLKRSTYGVAEAMSARGMTYGMEEWGGTKMVSAGVMVLQRYVGVDEFMTFSRETLDGIKVVLSNQKATYNKTGFHLETPTNCSVVACGNPKNDEWDESASAIENMEPVPVAVLTRMNVFRVKLHDKHDERSARIRANFMGEEAARAPVERDALAHWLEWAAARDEPRRTAPAADALEAYFAAFWGKRQKAHSNPLVQMRLEISAYRNACGFARLLGDAEVGREHAELAIEMLGKSMESIGVRVGAAAEELDRPRVGREQALTECVQGLDRLRGDRCFADEDVMRAMRQHHPDLWPTDDHAWSFMLKRIDQITYKPHGDKRLRANC